MKIKVREAEGLLLVWLYYKADGIDPYVKYSDLDGEPVEGETELIAVLRCHVIIRLGEEVEVPDEVLELIKWLSNENE